MTARQVFDLIIRAADRQLATAEVARPIIAAGLEQHLRSIIEQVAANAANPIADAFEDAALARAG